MLRTSRQQRNDLLRCRILSRRYGRGNILKNFVNPSLKRRPGESISDRITRKMNLSNQESTVLKKHLGNMNKTNPYAFTTVDKKKLTDIDSRMKNLKVKRDTGVIPHVGSPLSHNEVLEFQRLRRIQKRRKQVVDISPRGYNSPQKGKNLITHMNNMRRIRKMKTTISYVEAGLISKRVFEGDGSIQRVLLKDLEKRLYDNNR